MKITAEQVKTLRDKTGIAVMVCKRALVKAIGDQAEAESLLQQIYGQDYARSGYAGSAVARLAYIDRRIDEVLPLTITLTRDEARLAMIGLGIWRSDYEGCAHFDANADEAKELTQRLAQLVDRRGDQ